MSRNKIFEKYRDFTIKDKDRSLKNFIHTMLNKTIQMFEYRNLPDTIPRDILETMLQTNGDVLWYEVDGELYVFTGGLGGEPDVYYRPTIYTIANPALKISKNVKIGEEGVLMRNDTHHDGILPMLYKYGSILIEGDISFYNAIINTRDYNAFSASDDDTRLSVEEYQRQIEAGNTAVIAETPLLEGLRRHPTTQGVAPMADLRETYQYIKSLLYSDLGLKVSHNMKRQYVSEEENIVNDDTLIPLVDNMLECRELAIEEVNEMFGTNIEVSLKGTWELQREELENAIEILEKGEFEDEKSESIREVESKEKEEVREIQEDEEQQDNTTKKDGNEEDSQEDNEPEDEEDNTTKEDGNEEDTREDYETEEDTREDYEIEEDAREDSETEDEEDSETENIENEGVEVNVEVNVEGEDVDVDVDSVDSVGYDNRDDESVDE